MELGCPVCLSLVWRGPGAPKAIAINRKAHEMFYRCQNCGTVWLETERWATPLTPADADAALGAKGTRRWNGR